jgi:hypothetical protein
MTHQTDEKLVTNLTEYFVGVVKLACYFLTLFSITCHLQIITLNIYQIGQHKKS